MGCPHGKVGTKWQLAFVSGKGRFTQQLCQNSSTCWTSGIGLLFTAVEMDGFLCPFSCCFSSSQCLKLARVPPRVPAGLSDSLISDQNQDRQFKVKKPQKVPKDCCCSLSKSGKRKKEEKRLA